jgi:hypothetical protein
MHRNRLAQSKLTVTSGLLMATGALLYLADRVQTPRNWHLLLVPSLVLMGLGAILAAAGAIVNSSSERATDGR